MTRVAVLGSLMQDLVVRAARLPVPGETIFGRDFGMFAGGKGGNQAIAAARLGASHVGMIGAVGADPFAPAILGALEGAGVDTRHVRRDAVEGTGVAIPVVFDDGSNTIISVPRANLGLTGDDVERAAGLIRAADVLLLQFEVAQEANVRASRVAADAGVPVILNAAPVAESPPELIAAARVVVVNELEAVALAPAAGSVPAQAAAIRKLGPDVAVVTLGAEGCYVSSRELEGFIPAFEVEAVDSVGAGDAFCGALAVTLGEGQPLGEAARFASAAGALAATRPGAAASLPYRREVKELAGLGTL